MDFASLMKSQINATASKDSGGKKYLKRGELEAQRESRYRQEQEEAEQAREEKLRQKRKREAEDVEAHVAREEKKQRLAEESRKIREEFEHQEENARRKRLGLLELPKLMPSKEVTPLREGMEDIEEEDLLAKLKDLGEPRRLFGETHMQRLKRYRKLTAPVIQMTKGPIPTSIALVDEKHMKVSSAVPKDDDREGKKYLYRQLASYFDMILTEWAAALTRRPQAVKDSVSGKQAAQSYIAARDSLKPLVRQMEAETLDVDILAAVNEIVDLAQQKRYVHANDAYLRLSIGKAPWPIGVTMVGIHERSAREKLHETEKGKNAAHILADETTRKMLQGIKRCLSFAQTRWPPDDLGQLMG